MMLSFDIVCCKHDSGGIAYWNHCCFTFYLFISVAQMTEMPAVQVLQKDKKQEGLEEMKLIAQTLF